MAGELFIGIDSGTQGVKVGILDPDKGLMIARAAAPHSIIEGPGGRREQDPAWWMKALSTALDAALAAPGVDRNLVRAIGVSGQQHGLVALDSAGEVIRPAKLWCDTETAPQAEALSNRLGGAARAVELTGNAVAPGFTASKVAWLRETDPAAYHRLAMILLPHDYLNFRLTGHHTSEFGDASGTGYFNVTDRTWSAGMLRALDPSGRLEKCLPRLIGFDEPAGVLRPEMAVRFGLPPDVLVSAGGGDNMMAAIGTGNVTPGVVTASLGTSGTIFATAERPVIDPRGEAAAFCGSTGMWLPLVCTMNATVATEAVRNLLDRDVDDFSRLAEASPPGAEGVLLVPFFNGERTPALPRATASLTGLTPANLTPANLCRAAVEGPTFGLRYGLEALERLGLEPTEIRLTGGGAQNRLWRRVVAAVFNLPVRCPVETETAALGAAIQALYCFERSRGATVDYGRLTDRLVRFDEDMIQPDPAQTRIYDQLYQRYLATVETLKPLFDDR